MAGRYEVEFVGSKQTQYNRTVHEFDESFEAFTAVTIQVKKIST
jgi:hypothetical protein